jgi:hypothetical protein
VREGPIEWWRLDGETVAVTRGTTVKALLDPVNHNLNIIQNVYESIGFYFRVLFSLFHCLW